MGSNSDNFNVGQNHQVGNRLFVWLLFILSIAIFCSVARAETDPFELMDSMKLQFETAINKGDTKAAKQILDSIDSRFDRYGNATKASAYATLYAGGASRKSKLLNKLFTEQPQQFEKVALLLSSINIGNTNHSIASGKITFSGKISDSQSGKQIGGAKIFIAGQTAITNKNGDFILHNLPIGRFDFISFAPGYKFIIYPSTSIKENKQSEQNVTLTKNKMQPRSLKSLGTETLIGTLLDADTGMPIVNAKVIMGCKSAIKNTTSDKQGKFVINGIPTEICSFSVMQSNVTDFADLYKKVKTNTDRAYGFTAEYNITSNANHKHEKVWKIKSSSLPPGGTIKGVVLNSVNGLPVVGADVIVGARRIGVVVFDGKTARTDNQGQFEIQFAPIGEQTLEVNKEIFKPSTQKIKVIAANTIAITISLHPITIGTVTGIALSAIDHKPLAGVTISVGSKLIKTDAEGRFTLTDIDAGEVTVGGSKAVFKSTSKSIEVAAAKSTNVTLDLMPITQGNITGIATNASNHKPLASVTILLGKKTVLTDAEGKFTLKDIDAGEVTVHGSKAIFKPTTKPVKVVAAKTVTMTLDLVPITQGNITGMTRNAISHQPLPGVKITAGEKSTLTDAQGRFTLNTINAGKVSVSGSKSVFKSTSKTVTVAAAKNIKMTLDLMPITQGNITGIATNATTHKPLAGVNISVGNKTTETDSEGKFTLKDIESGEVTIDGSKAIFKPISKIVKVAAAKNINVTLNLQPITEGSINGIVVNASNNKPLSMVTVSVGSINVVTDDKGHFVIDHVIAGATLVQANKKVFEPASKNTKVIAADSIKVTLKLKPITVGSINGLAVNIITNKPLAATLITVGSKTTKTDANGHFAFSNMPIGNTSIMASKPVYKPASQQIDVIAAETVTTTLKLQPITVGTVSGVVVNATNQKPISGATVILGTISTTTDNKGHFKIKEVNAGTVSLQAEKPVFLKDSKTIKIIAAGSVNVILKLKPITTANLDGVVVDKKTGKSISDVRVSVLSHAVITSTDGKYAFQDINAGKITILAQHPDYKAGRKNLKLPAGKTFHQKIKLERRREDVVELEAALKAKGTVDLYGIHFDSGKDQFLPSSLSTLQAVSVVIKSSAGKTFEIAGHTDSDGNGIYNQKLSERRANTVIKWLVRHGVNKKQLRAKGYGEDKPVVPNNSEAGKALNRRVQLKIFQ